MECVFLNILELEVKSGTSDANAEFVGEIRSIFNEANVVWQSGN